MLISIAHIIPVREKNKINDKMASSFFQFTQKNFLFSIGLLLLGLALNSCVLNGKKDIRNYYFPLKLIRDGMVYEYRSVGESVLGPQYWYYRSIFNEGKVFLTGTFYEEDLIPKQFIREEMVHNGMLLEEILLFNTDSVSGKQKPHKLNIEASNAFPFLVSNPGGIFLYKISWKDPVDTLLTTTLIKNRRYVGDTTLVFKEKSYKAVIFEVKEAVEVESEGVLEQQFKTTEYYAKGLGLVYFRKEITAGMNFAYKLYDTYPMEVLEKKFLERHPPEEMIQ